MGDQLPPRAPGAKWYVLAILLLTVVPLAFLGGIMALGVTPFGRALAEAITGMFGVLGDARLNNVETFPGTVTWQLDEAGPWNVRIAYDAALDRPPPLGALRCTLRAEATGAAIELLPCEDEVPAYHSGFLSAPRRSAEVFLFDVPAGGAYVFDAKYPDGALEPKIELAASKGHAGEPKGIFWTRRRKAHLLEAGAALSFLSGAVLLVAVWRRRRRAAAPEAPSLPPS